ncbi:MAG TPA: serine protease [Croceibacterium sp.]
MTHSIGRLTRALALLLLGLLAPAAAQADPADIDAAARGVVRVVIVEIDGDEVIPVSHGTGFAVGPEQVITNAHVVAEARADDELAIGIVPSDGENAVYGRLVAVSQRNDLALISTTSQMRLPPLTIAGNATSDSGSVTSVGYPMNVDRAQGLSMSDIFRAQPPVKSTGALAGRRPTRDFDSLLHTAPIARGSSGGPLLDDCGRVIGVNSFGAESSGAEAEFYFAVSARELLTFLRANSVTPQVNGMPCRSLATLEAEERARAERAQLTAQLRAEADEEALARRREDERRGVEFALMAERENGLALALALLVVALGAGGAAWQLHERGERQRMKIAGAVAGLAVGGALVAWILRPGYDEVDSRLEDLLHAEMEARDSGPVAAAATSGALVCVLDPERSRVTGTAPEDLPFDWSPTGCVNSRTQYGFAEGTWSRVLVPDEEAVVSVNSFDPAAREYRVERYLLDREAMGRARTARAEFQAPACGGGDESARQFGAQQQAVLSLLPERPNERLVYKCAEAAR